MIKEGQRVNIDVTAPGATLALGLMFLRSNNEAVAGRLRVPDTQFLLDYVRPDFILLRVVARSLVMWDAVEPTNRWLADLTPRFIRAQTTLMRPPPDLRGGNATGASAGSDENEASGQISTADLASINQAQANIVAGACLAIGLRFAGTANAEAFEWLSSRVDRFVDLLAGRAVVGLSRATAETCLSTAAIALSLVMAGTGNLAVLRTLRRLRARRDDALRYGDHLAISMAIGFLFLGAGTATLGRSNADIAALLIAVFPRFPDSSSDNRYHLQVRAEKGGGVAVVG